MNLVVLLGAPGSGKGTQAKLLEQKLPVLQISTGDLLREAIKQASPVGLKAKQFVEKGELVPDQIMIELIESKLKQAPPSHKILLDGFPRTLPQAKALDANKKTQVGLVLYFHVPSSILVERITGRRTCADCSSIYHVDFNPPKKSGQCDRCGGKLTQRKDDVAEVVLRRLEVFEKENKVLVDYYTSKNLLKEIDANQSLANVQSQLLKVLDTWCT